MKYVKKPLPVDAWQIDLLEIEYQGNIPDWVSDALKNNVIERVDKLLSIYTFEGKMFANDGDYLIKGPLGEFWFNKREIFEQMYEPVE